VSNRAVGGISRVDAVFEQVETAVDRVLGMRRYRNMQVAIGRFGVTFVILSGKRNLAFLVVTRRYIESLGDLIVTPHKYQGKIVLLCFPKELLN
jgi:hypothetical protein